jgi:sec-independent protein translocase protein TatB
MPQIGWFEILIIVVLAILIIGPKDFPIVLKKIGKWTTYIKNYFSNIQKDFTDIQDDIKDKVYLEKEISNITNDSNEEKK